MSGSLAPVVWAGSMLLVGGGITKLTQPLGAIPALRATGLPAHRRLVRALGVLEIGLGGICLFIPSTVSVASLGALYLAFSAFIARLVTKGVPGVSCGCAGKRDIRPSYLHAGLNLVAGVALLVAAWAPISILSVVGSIGAGTIAVSAGSAAIAWASYLAVAYVPELFGSWKGAS